MTLKAALNRIVMITLLLVVIVSLALIFSYSKIKQSLSILTLEALLRKNSSFQAEALLPSFLMPEQKEGVGLLLSRFKEADGLKEAKLISSFDGIPAEFSECEKSKEVSYCTDRTRRTVATLIPISLQEKTFGYLLKTKEIPNFFENDHFLFLIQCLVGTGILSFLILFLFLGRVTTYDLPGDLQELAIWVEGLIKEDLYKQRPKLRFSELEELAENIGQMFRQHQSLRDQALIGQLTSGILHDLRNPLHPLVAALQLVEECPPEKGEEKEKRNRRLENLYRVCKGKLPIMGEMIESTLDGGREIAINPQVEDLRITVLASTTSFSKLIEKKGITLQLRLGESERWIPHDSVQIGRVFNNLIKNAIEAFDPPYDGKRGDAKIQILIEERDEQLLSVCVEDSGPGLPGNVEGIFRAFRSTKARGTGLGLVVSRKIVETHGGKLSASSSETLSGAKFEVLLPVQKQECI